MPVLRFKTLQKRFASDVWPEFKNKSNFPPVEGQAPRCRAAKSLPSRQDSLSAYRLTRDFLLSLINARESTNPMLCPTPGAPPEADVCRHTEKMLRSISHLVKGIFDLSRSSVFLSHGASSSWQLVDDKCRGLAGIGAIAPGKLRYCGTNSSDSWRAQHRKPELWNFSLSSGEYVHAC